MGRCTIPQGRQLSVQLQANLIQKIVGQVTCHVFIRVQPKEDLRLKLVILTEPERNSTDGRGLSPVRDNWRKGQIRSLFGPSLGRDWSVMVR